MRVGNYDIGFDGFTRSVLVLLVVTVLLYPLQVALDGMTYLGFRSMFGLSVAGVLQGHLWQFVSYLFLHGNLWHLLLNMLALTMLGPELERTIGARSFLVIYFLSGILGGLGWLLLTYPLESVCVGASGAICGILGAFAALFPERRMTLLLFFVIPITMQTWILVLGMAVVQILLLVWHEGGGIAYSAHLAGGLAGYIYALTVYRPHALGLWRSSLREHLVRRRAQQASRRDEGLRIEVDRVLDKVARDGIHSITESERRLLQEASRRTGR